MKKPSCPMPSLARTAAIAAVAMLAACAQVTPREANPSHFLHDAAFPEAASYRVESASEVFELDEDAQRQLDRKFGRGRKPKVRDQVFMSEIGGNLAAKLRYDSSADTTASQTFRNRTANCLSLSILVYAMARHLGYAAEFREVNIPEFWERRDTYSAVARHVNLRIQTRAVPGALSFGDVMEVDFFAPGSARRFGSRSIDSARVLAMYYNNKGVDALFSDDHAAAYAYLRAALLEDPSLDMTLGNLGMLYAMNGRLQWAEQSYREAMRLDPDSTVSAEGLASILQSTGRAEEAKEIFARLERRRRDNPYYHFVQGEEAYDAGDWQRALRAFRRAIELQPDFHQPYFGLARIYYRLGDRERAAAYLRQAARHAGESRVRQRYQGKIGALSGI